MEFMISVRVSGFVRCWNDDSGMMTDREIRSRIGWW